MSNYPCPKCRKNRTFVVSDEAFGDCLRCASCRETFVPLFWDGHEQSWISKQDLELIAEDVHQQIEEWIEQFEAAENAPPDHYWN